MALSSANNGQLYYCVIVGDINNDEFYNINDINDLDDSFLYKIQKDLSIVCNDNYYKNNCKTNHYNK